MRNEEKTAFSVKRFALMLVLFAVMGGMAQALAQVASTRTLSGVVVSRKNESVRGASIVVLSARDRQTVVTDSDYFRHTTPRVYIDSAPHLVSNAGLTLAGWRGLSGSLRYRHISSYRLDGEDASIKASGLDVLDLSLSKRIRRWLDFNLSVDNLTGKVYYETQNFFESRVRPGDPVIFRIRATPGYPVTVTAGVTFHLFEK